MREFIIHSRTILDVFLYYLIFKKKNINNLLVGLANKGKDGFGIYLSLFCDVYIDVIKPRRPIAYASEPRLAW